MKRTIGSLAIAAAAGIVALSGVTPANAALTTRCIGEGGAVTVPGDLIVPAGRSCTLTGTVVQGDVRVARGGDLIANGVTVSGRLIAAADSYVDATGTAISAGVVLSGVYGATLAETQVGSGVRSAPTADSTGVALVYVTGSDITGDLRATGGEIFVDGSSLTGSITSVGTAYTDVYDSFVDGRLDVSESASGSVVCASAIQGTSTFAANAGLVQLGANGPSADCATGSYWGGTVTASANTGGVYVGNSIVGADLVFDSNAPVAQVAAGNVVRGTITGEFAEWDGSPAVPERRAAPVQRDDALASKLDERRTAALAESASAGAAQIG